MCREWRRARRLPRAGRPTEVRPRLSATRSPMTACIGTCPSFAPKAIACRQPARSGLSGLAWSECELCLQTEQTIVDLHIARTRIQTEDGRSLRVGQVHCGTGERERIGDMVGNRGIHLAERLVVDRQVARAVAGCRFHP